MAQLVQLIKDGSYMNPQNLSSINVSVRKYRTIYTEDEYGPVDFNTNVLKEIVNSGDFVNLGNNDSLYLINRHNVVSLSPFVDCTEIRMKGGGLVLDNKPPQEVSRILDEGPIPQWTFKIYLSLPEDKIHRLWEIADATPEQKQVLNKVPIESVPVYFDNTDYKFEYMGPASSVRRWCISFPLSWDSNPSYRFRILYAGHELKFDAKKKNEVGDFVLEFM